MSDDKSTVWNAIKDSYGTNYRIPASDQISPRGYFHLAEWPQASNHEDVKFRGRRLGDLTREELIEALYQALTELKYKTGV